MKKGSKIQLKNMTRDEFRQYANPLAVRLTDATVGLPMDLEHKANPKEWSTGSLGWTSSQRAWVKVNGKWLLCTANLSITVIGSKALPQDGHDFVEEVGCVG